MNSNKIIWVLAMVLVIIAIYTVNNNQVNPDTDNKNLNIEQSADSQKNDEQDNNKGQESSIAEKILAPDFTLKDLNGNDVSLKDFRGKNVYINFWATWCPPCKAEMPEIEKLYQETKDSDLVILAIDIGEDKKTVTDFINENKYNFSVLLDGNNEVASAYGVTSIPVSLFIDKEGYIVNGQVGAMNLEQMKGYLDAFE